MALPTVSAPTTAPMARPRPERNQVATIFMAGGYTPASMAPVRNRSTTAHPYRGATTTRAFTAAAEAAATAKYSRDGHTSARFRTAATPVPATNPMLTTVVSQAD